MTDEAFEAKRATLPSSVLKLIDDEPDPKKAAIRKRIFAKTDIEFIYPKSKEDEQRQTSVNELAQAPVDREDYAHPEKIYKGLIYSEGKYSDELQEARKEITSRFSELLTEGGDPKEIELCWSCGWNAYHELGASYGSRIRILHTHGGVGIWEIGSRWLIRDQPNDNTIGNDFITQEFLRQQPNLDIPIVKEMRVLSAPTDKVVLTLMSRVQGVGLDTIWNTLTPEQKSNYRDQLRNAIKQWRQFTSTVASKVNGEVLDDSLIGTCSQRVSPTCTKMGRTTEEWFENLERDLRFGLSHIHRTKDPLVIEEKFQELKRNFPKSEPYVLTHGDLNLSNILVKDDKIQGIIDWEFAGYLPWWVERWHSLTGSVTDESYEFFESLWDDIDEGMDRDTFQREIVLNVAPVAEARNAILGRVEHRNSNKVWLRPGFCKCQPFAGGFRWSKIGHSLEHISKDVAIEE